MSMTLLIIKSELLEINNYLDKEKRKNQLMIEINTYIETLKTKWIDNCKIACFSTSNSQSGIEGFQLANLWSYYAENHSGVCIAFDKKKVLSYFDENFSHLYPLHNIVEYKNKLGHFKYNTKYNQNEYKGIEDNKSSLFFEKLKAWDREQEYRLICFSKNEFEYIPIQGILCEIILGQKATENNKLKIQTNFPNIKVSKMNYFSGAGKFEKIDVKDKFWKEFARIEN